MQSSSSITIIGRSSSHFTRVTRIVAFELGVPYTLQVVRDLTSLDVADYGGNPALRMPTLRTSQGVWFGALGICRELERLSKRARRVLWPEDLPGALHGSAQELVTQAMSTEVALVMARAAGDHGQLKPEKSLLNMLAWLDDHAPDAVSSLPERDLSFLEVTLFCLVTHLEFRDVVSVAPYPALAELCRVFGQRKSAQQTEFHFDP